MEPSQFIKLIKKPSDFLQPCSCNVNMATADFDVLYYRKAISMFGLVYTLTNLDLHLTYSVKSIL